MLNDRLPRCETTRPSRAGGNSQYATKTDFGPVGPDAWFAENEARIRVKEAEVQAELRRLKIGRFANQEAVNG